MENSSAGVFSLAFPRLMGRGHRGGLGEDRESLWPRGVSLVGMETVIDDVLLCV